MSIPENEPVKFKFKTWQKIIIGFIVLSFIGALFGNSGSSSNVTEFVAPEDTSSSDVSWIPTGFNAYSGDDSVAWRWGTKSETKCTYDSSSCWSVMVVTKDGCPNGIYAEIAILDSSGVQIDYTNDGTAMVLAESKVKLTFDTFNEQADTARIGEINCR